MSRFQQPRSPVNHIQNRQPSKIRSDIDGQVNQILGDKAMRLSWDNKNKNSDILHGNTDYSIFSDYKGSISKFWNDFFAGRSNLDLTGSNSELVHRRLIQLQHQIEGLLRRKIQLSFKDVDGAQRLLDYTGILNEKENQIVELEKKNQNLQEKLRRIHQREVDLQDEIQKLKKAFLRLQKPGVSRYDIEALLRGLTEHKVLQQKYNSLKDRLTGFAGLLKTQSNRLKTQGVTLNFQSDLQTLARQQGINVQLSANGVINIIQYKDRVVQIPVSDARTKHLIHILATQIKKLFEKYPKLREQIDSRLTEFFQQELIDIIDVDELDKIVEIVKYVPDIYRVQNVYAYNSQKSRRVQFHLRVLLKALLQQLEKLKARLGPGQVLDLDEGVIGMINAQILNVVNVDDILKVFRVVPKIVEVEKIVQKIVQRVVEIPQVVQVQKVIQKIVQVPKIVQLEKLVHVPVQVVKYIDVYHDKIIPVQTIIQKVVEVPNMVQRLVQKVIQKPKIVIQQVIVEKIVEVQKPSVVQRIVHVPVVQVQVVQVIKQKVVQVQKIIEKPYPVEVIVQKFVERVVYIPQLVTVQVRNDVIVQKVDIQVAQQIINHVQTVPYVVQMIHQRPVPLVETIQRIIQIPQIIQKIVQVAVHIPIIKQVVVIEQKIVFRDRIIQVQRIITKPVEVIHEVQKIIQKVIQVPVFYETIIRVPQIITQVAIERVQMPIIIEIQKFVDRIIEVPKIIQIQTQKTVEVRVDNPVNIIVEKIVEVPRVIEKIKQVRVTVDKIVQKMVQVPKVIQVQKVVEKIVLIPRVIDKIVQVPQFTQKVVQKIVQTTKIVEVQKIIQVPVFFEKLKIVQVPIKCYYNEKDAELYNQNQKQKQKNVNT